MSRGLAANLFHPFRADVHPKSIADLTAGSGVVILRPAYARASTLLWMSLCLEGMTGIMARLTAAATQLNNLRQSRDTLLIDGQYRNQARRIPAGIAA